MENERELSREYWIGFAMGAFTMFMLCLTLGILEYRGLI